MPNQRKEGKSRIAIWLTKTQRIVLDNAIKKGVCRDMSDFVIQAIAAEKKKQEVHK
mgnify:CR=1 FL=1